MSDSKKKGTRRADAIKSAPTKPEDRKYEPEIPGVNAPAKPAPAPEAAESKPAPAAKPAAPKKKKSVFDTIENGILIFGFLVMFASMFLMDFRNAVAGAVDVIISPITATMPFYIVVLAIAAIVTVFSTFIQKYTMDWELMRTVTEKNRALQKEMREAQLSGNKAKLKKLQDDQLSGMQEQTALTKMQFKPMGFLAIISVPLFIWAYWYLSMNPSITMVFPFAGTITLISGGFFIFPWWILWSLLCSMAIGQIVRKAFNVGMSV
ncbi:MAG TPA: EMC3/TMCO1 family protein [Methanocella sp.]|jgi:uncharacterized membrane protein (DUF106 family)